MNKVIIVGCVLATVATAVAAPPPGADMTYAPWYQGLTVPQNGTVIAGSLCCAISDCRPVQYRMAGTHYEAFVDTQSFGSNAPNQWLTVPDNVVIRQTVNPTGEGVLCFFLGQVRCFVPASGT